METPALTNLPKLSSWLRYGKLSCEQAIAKSLDAISRDGQRKTIFTHIATDAAPAQARGMDAVNAAHEATKPLAGMPFAAGETIAIAGQPTTTGTSVDLSDLMPAQGPFARKLQELGAIFIGKTAGTEFSLSFHDTGRKLPGNPCYDDGAYVFGGTAAAVAVANGLCSFALGADGAGSTRASAALCGVTAFRPGVDFWSREGMFPLSRELDTVGLVTRTASDLAFLLEGLGSGTVPKLDGTPLRLGVAKTPFFEDLDPAIAEAIKGLFVALTKKNAVLTPIVIPDYQPLKYFAQIANGTALVRFIGRERTERMLPELDPLTRLALRPGMDMGTMEIQRMFDNRRALANKINVNLAHIDALIMPTLPGLAMSTASLADAQAALNWQTHMARNVDFANIFNMTAVSIPLPASQPIGLQLLAPAGNEIKLAGVARAVQHALDSAA